VNARSTNGSRRVLVASYSSSWETRVRWSAAGSLLLRRRCGTTGQSTRIRGSHKARRESFAFVESTGRNPAWSSLAHWRRKWNASGKNGAAAGRAIRKRLARFQNSHRRKARKPIRSGAHVAAAPSSTVAAAPSQTEPVVPQPNQRFRDSGSRGENPPPSIQK
jgi:hypothetical protein